MSILVAGKMSNTSFLLPLADSNLNVDDPN
jgi:hypothetical protein